MLKYILLCSTFTAALIACPHDTVIVFDINDVLIDAQNNVIPETIGCAQQLYSNQYMLFIFSNTHSTYFDKTKNKHPGFTLYFTGAYTYSAANNFVSKKSPEAFQKLLQNYILPAFTAKHGKLPKTIIFIDDKQSRLTTAQKGLKLLQEQHSHLRDITLKTIVYTPNMDLQSVLSQIHGGLVL